MTVVRPRGMFSWDRGFRGVDGWVVLMSLGEKKPNMVGFS